MNDFEEATLHLKLLAQAIKDKNEDPEYGAPELVKIEHDGYHAAHIGNAAGRHSF